MTEDILIKALNEIIENAPSCINDNDCQLNGGDGFDQGCIRCHVVLAKQALTDYYNQKLKSLKHNIDASTMERETITNLILKE